MTALTALDQQLRDDSSDEDEGDSSDDGSFGLEECLSDDDESYVSYYSMDCLSVIEEETDQDILNEISTRGSQSSRCRSIDVADDLPPSPPKRTLSQDNKLFAASKISSGQESALLVQAGSLTRKSVYSYPDLISSIATDEGVRDSPSEDKQEDAFSCYSAPLNDVEEDFRVGGSPGRLERTLFDKANASSISVDSPANKNGMPMISFETGEEICAAQSDDDYTFVSCTTGDDMSFVSDLGSSHHNRTIFDMQGLDDDLQSSEHQRTTGRRGSGISLDAEKLLPMIHEDEGFHEPDTTVSYQPLDYRQMQKKLDIQITQNQMLTSSPSQENESSKYNRLVALKHRLRLERYSGVRSRKSFERSKKLLGRSFGNIQKTDRSRTTSRPASVSNTDRAETSRRQPKPETLARFGGLTRRESFKNSKTEFQKKFDKQVKPLVFRRRRSLSPVRRQSSFDRKDFITRMSKSDGHLLFNPKGLEEDSEEEKEKSTDDLVLDPKFEENARKRQERFGGLRRRNSFKRSCRVLTKKFDRIQARSSDEKERFGGLQRMKSYKQSRVLFQQAITLLDDTSESSDPAEEDEDDIKSEKAKTGKGFRKARRSTPRSAWSDNLARSRLHTSSDPEMVGKRMENSPDLRRARKHLQHALKTHQPQSVRQ